MDNQAVHDGDEPATVVLHVDPNPDIASELEDTFGSDIVYSRSSHFEGIEENGRTYQKVAAGKYELPNDESEQKRLDVQHQLFMLTFSGRLQLAPVVEPKVILDLGTGTGSWAIEFAKQHPQSTVVGTDFSAIQPPAPSNCSFEVADLEAEWMHARPFNYIHGRALATCFKDPLAIFRKAYAALAPGGWFEMQELYLKILSVDKTLDGTALQKWNNKCVEGSRLQSGKDWRCAVNYAAWFKDAGFHSVTEKHFYWPSNAWPQDPEHKEIGRICMKNYIAGLEGFSMSIFSKAYGMTFEEVRAELDDVAKDLKNTSIHAYTPIIVVYGRKPHPDDK